LSEGLKNKLGAVSLIVLLPENQLYIQAYIIYSNLVNLRIMWEFSQWSSMGLNRAQLGLNRAQLGLNRAQLGLNGAQWGSMELNGAQWGSMGLNGAQWGSMGLKGAQ